MTEGAEPTEQPAKDGGSDAVEDAASIAIDGEAMAASMPDSGSASGSVSHEDEPDEASLLAPSEVVEELPASAATQETAKDVGPDPLWGAASAFLGFFVMAVGGATDRHYVFNVGSGIMLVGAAVFLIQMAVTRYRQDPFHPVEVIRALFQRRS